MDTAETLVQKGLAFAQQGIFDQALSCLKRAENIKANAGDKKLYYHLGNTYAALGELSAAKKYLSQAIQIDFSYAEAHNNLGRLFYKQGIYEHAALHYRAALESRHHYEEAALNLGYLLLKQGQTSDAKAHFLSMISWSSKLVIVYEQLAQLSLQSAAVSEAAGYYKKVLDMSKSSDTWNNAGAVSIQMGRDQEALERLTQALILNPKHVYARNNRAALYLKKKDFEHAIFDYTLYLNLVPDDSEGRYNLGVALMSIGRLDEATDAFRDVLSKYVGHVDAQSNLARIYLKQKNWTAAATAYRGILDSCPEHATAHFMLRALSQPDSDIPPKPPLDHTKALFDDYAEHFDEHLQQQLHYQLPGHVYSTLQPYLSDMYYAGLDLGCGTGLVAAAFKRVNMGWTGVDVSSRMIKKAEAKLIYEHLVEADIERFVETTSKRYGLITCIDTLVYIGSLERIMAGAYRVALHQTYFIFSVVLTDRCPRGQGYALEPTGRYQHALDYVKSTAENFRWRWIHHRLVEGRANHGTPVTIALCVLQKFGSIKV